MVEQEASQWRDPLPPEIDEIWHLRASYDGHVGINALGVSEKADGGRGIKVALCDFGVDYDHPALQDQIDLEAARDFDHTLGEEGLRHPKGRIADPLDPHGTACAGLVCGRSDPLRQNTELPEESRFRGVAPNCKVIPIRLSTNFEECSITAALHHANSASDVLLLPRFFPKSPKLTKELEAVAREIPVICASGNDGTGALAYPASVQGVIAVGACNDKGYRSTYSQYGEGLTVTAPSADEPCEYRKFVRLTEEEAKRRAHLARQREEEARGQLELAIAIAKTASAKKAAHGPEQQTEEARIQVARAEQRVKDANQEREYAEDLEKWHVARLGLRSITTTDNRGELGYNPKDDYTLSTGDFGFGGTSAAASQVAGVVALMLAANSKLKRNPEAVQKILRETARNDVLKPELGVGLKEFGAGLVDVVKAVDAALWFSPDSAEAQART